jgi:hypothetical protein
VTTPEELSDLIGKVPVTHDNVAMVMRWLDTYRTRCLAHVAQRHPKGEERRLIDQERETLAGCILMLIDPLGLQATGS